MELSWSTFLLEIINFLVLVWILKRFLYQPVLAVIARRRAAIEEGVAQAQRLQEDAHALKAQYEDRMADWEKERQQARDTLAQELEEERARQLQRLQQSLQQEQDKARVAEARRREEAARETEHQALQQSARFAQRLLSVAAGPELETRLLELFLQDLAALTPEQLSALRNSWGEAPEAIEVISVWPLPETQQQQLTQALSTMTGLAVPVNYSQHAELLAGLQITIGAWVLHLNLRDELKGFAEFAHATR